MAENEKALIDAVAALYEDSPEYARGLIDGLQVAGNAAKAKEARADEPGQPQEAETE